MLYVSVAGSILLIALVTLAFLLLAMFIFTSILPAAALFVLPSIAAQNKTSTSGKVDINWHAPNATDVNNLETVINGTGVYGFIFNSSQLPNGTKYGTYNWCNMPHIRTQEYPRANEEYQLEYVEVIHRHHKRTLYQDNCFPKESYPWYCSDEGLFYYGEPIKPSGNVSSPIYWSVYTTSNNPFAPSGFNGTCQFPQITRSGLDDSWQHGRDLYDVYYGLLNFLPSSLNSTKVTYRVTNNVITSEVAGMLISAMYPSTQKGITPVLIQPDSIDSLEPAYSCSDADDLYSSYGEGSSAANWTVHLKESQSLYDTLDSISGVDTSSSAWHDWWDHYFDNLSSRQCHGKTLPCKIGNSSRCINQDEANEVYRLGEYEYSFIYRDSPKSLQASTASFGVWIGELAQNFRDSVSGASILIYRHNVAHDGSIARLLSILQVDKMVWPGMGSEIVFELYSKKGESHTRYVRILWGGQVFRSSNPSLGLVDMLDLSILLEYFDSLVGVKGEKISGLCGEKS
ncbi:MAG: hypothetical protein M1834_007662 [Cirrosporium novae-zelandiae]|nr:MAG: hypothetical protein M1834_007662 [Cirrosporium novae-zelandiae]